MVVACLSWFLSLIAFLFTCTLHKKFVSRILTLSFFMTGKNQVFFNHSSIFIIFLSKIKTLYKNISKHYLRCHLKGKIFYIKKLSCEKYVFSGMKINRLAMNYRMCFFLLDLRPTEGPMKP